MENIVKVWSDYLKVKIHPRSVHLLSDYFHNNSIEPFDVYSQGASYWNKEEKRDEIEDSIRWYVEDCDYLQVSHSSWCWMCSADFIILINFPQGFQMLSDADNGFGGLAGHILEHLSEEYPRKTRFTFPLLPTMRLKDPAHVDYVNEKNSRLINSGFVLESMFEHSSIFSPLSLDSSWASSDVRKLKQLQYQVKILHSCSRMGFILKNSVQYPGLHDPFSSPIRFILLENHFIMFLIKRRAWLMCRFLLLFLVRFTLPHKRNSSDRFGDDHSTSTKEIWSLSHFARFRAQLSLFRTKRA